MVNTIPVRNWLGELRFECKSCHKTHRHQEAADRCCRCEICEKQEVLCSGTREGKTVCRDCQTKWDIDHAEVVLDDGKPVFAPDGDYYTDLEHAWDDIDAFPPGKEHFVFASKPVIWQFDLVPALEEAVDKFFENVDDDSIMDYDNPASSLKGVKELQEAVNQFNELNKDTFVFYEVDRKRKIRVPNCNAERGNDE